ncbi:MAG: cupin domain-containing protein [Polyangiales bacterium]
MRKLAFLSFVTVVIAVGCGGSKAPDAKSGGESSGGGKPAESAGESGAGGSSSSSSGEAAPAAASPAAAAEKIDGALPETKDAKPFPRRAECPKNGCNNRLVVPDALKPAADDKAPIVMWEEVMPPKAMMLFPRIAGLDLYGMLIDGEVSIMADDIKDKQKRAWRLNGFHAPGVGVNIYSKEPTRIILMAVVNGTSGSVAEQIAKIEAKDKTIAWTKRSSPVTSFELPAKPDLAWAGGSAHARIAYEEAPAAMGFLILSKNASVPEHAHDKEWEFLAIIEGDGELTRKSAGNVKLSGSNFVSIPAGVAHGFKPSGSAPTYAIQMYWPPGPEQRFKKLASEGAK